MLGEAASPEAARQLIERYRDADLDAVLAAVTAFWDDTLGTVQVADARSDDGPDAQPLAVVPDARRAGSGRVPAFIRRAVLTAFAISCKTAWHSPSRVPALTREHLLRAAARQFPEGDVQHWWLPQGGAGVRTRISDDRAWLAYAVAQYVDVTGDRAILEVDVPFLEGRPLAAGEHDAYFVPTVSEISAAAVRALRACTGAKPWRCSARTACH